MDLNQDLEFLKSYFNRLFPINRSITGEGYRESLKILQEVIPFNLLSVPSGTQVFDWVVPEEWNIKNAWIKGPDGKKYADFSASNLSVVNYSQPIHKKISKKDLLPHLHTLPNLPDAIPYVTSYYKKTWGFCLNYNTYQSLPEGEYEVFIDSSFTNGEVVVGDTLIRGQSSKEILLTSYLCHPSMANNELSGPLVLALLFQRLKKWKKHRYSYRFVINPETIGSLCYLHLKNVELVKNVHSGLVLTCLGGKNKTLSYKETRAGHNSMDELVNYLKAEGSFDLRIREFTPLGGSDERQYNSPGFKLPVAQIARDVYGDYDFYHTSLDNLEFMGLESLLDSVNQIETILRLHELSGSFSNMQPFGEPQLGKRGLYPNVNSPLNWGEESKDSNDIIKKILYILNYSDGEHSMVDIAQKLDCSLASLEKIIEILESEKLLSFS